MVVSAVVVDISRLIIYGSTFFARDFAILKDRGGIELVLAGTLAAFLGVLQITTASAIPSPADAAAPPICGFRSSPD